MCLNFYSTTQYAEKIAASQQNQQNNLCARRRLRSAWASAQSDQSLLSTWRNLGSLATHWVHSEDSDQTRQIRVFAGHTPFCWFCCEAASISSPEPKAHRWAYSIGKHPPSTFSNDISSEAMKPILAYFKRNIYRQGERIILFFVPIG